MKRFAANYLYIPSRGYLKQQVVELDDAGIVVRYYLLDEEIESVSWLPGVIHLVPDTTDNSGTGYRAMQVYPFDFVQMQPAFYSKYFKLGGI